MKDKSASVVIAIGGNAIVKEYQKGTVEEQLSNIYESCEYIAALYEQGYQIALIHGNGPQVGNLLLQSEAEKNVPRQPIDVCGAMTQGQIGYMLQQCLKTLLQRRGIDTNVVTIVTQMLVSERDEAFQNPTKPIGPFYSREEAAQMMSERPDLVMVEDSGRGWRRVVPSPQPLEMIERDCARILLEQGCLVIAAGGGGIPVIRGESGIRGVKAVIDKDRAAALVARDIGADYLIILTGVDRVCVNFGKPDQKEIETMTADEAQAYLEEGQFPPGSMGPKIEAAIQYLRDGGRKVLITSINRLQEALENRCGTIITR